MQKAMQTPIREEELKNRVATAYFSKYDCDRIVGNIDFCVCTKGGKVCTKGGKVRRTDPIGFFDSGVGGLCVRDACIKLMPHESTWYIADSAHCPYGCRPPDEIVALHAVPPG